MKKALYNTISSGILQIMTLISGLILPRLILVTYGSSINGLRTSLTQFVNYLYILEVGLGGAIIFSLYKPLAEKDYDMINGILSAAKKAYKKIGFIFLGLLLLLAIVYPLLINKENVDLLTVVFLTLSIGTTGIINYFFIGSYTVLLTAAQFGYLLSIARTIYVIVNMIIMVILMNLRFNIALVYCISLVANLLHALILHKYSKKQFPHLNFKVTPIISALTKRYDVVLHQISGMIVFSAPVLLLTIFTDLKVVSVYSIYAMIFSSVGMIAGIFGNSFTAAFGDLIARKEYKVLKEAYSQYEYIYYGIVSFVYSSTLILGISFIKIYTKGITDINYEDYSILMLFTLMGILTSWKVPQSTIIVSAGHYRQTRHRAIIEACVTLIVSIPLVICFGLHGVLIGSVIGLLYRSIDLFYAERITKFKFKYTFQRISRMFSIIILSVIPFKTLIIIEVDSLMTWLMYAILVVVWVGFLVVSANYLFEKDTFIRITKKLKVIFNHKIK